jgi:hypothetical protein
MAQALRKWHQLRGRVRPVLGDACLVGKGRWPAAAVRWDSKPLPPCSGGRGPGRADAMTCGSFVLVVTARARRDPHVTDAIRTQCGPTTPSLPLVLVRASSTEV